VTLKNENSYKEGTYFTLLKTLKSVLMMIYPFSPFIAEEIYLNLPNHKESIMVESYPEFEDKFVFEDEEQRVNTIVELIEKVRQYKVENDLAPNYPLSLAIKANINLFDLYQYLVRFSFA
ncbi:MAG: class I tRNA ligase family protein, partial [Bacilli bacterium]|nr:class I tRNA ligase family protein [Bacilli bacterium]